MAKKRSIMAEDNENVVPVEHEAETTVNAENDAPKLNPALVLRNANSRLNIVTRNGQKRLWTIEQALLPQNYKQLTERQKRILSEGKSASQMVHESNHKL
jgi:hypothetical protein